jgi:hypothetical protein
MILDDDQAEGPWVDMHADYTAAMDAAEMPPSYDCGKLRELIADKPFLQRRPARLSELLKQDYGVVMTTDQVRKVQRADGFEVHIERVS